jgi:hypothetical protein
MVILALSLALLLACLAAYSLYWLQVERKDVQSLIRELFMLGIAGLFISIFYLLILMIILVPRLTAKIRHWFRKIFHLERPIKRESLDYEEVEGAVCTPRPLPHILSSLAVKILHQAGPQTKPDGQHIWICLAKPTGKIPEGGGWIVRKRTSNYWQYNDVAQRWEPKEPPRPYANPQWEAYRVADAESQWTTLGIISLEEGKPKSPYTIVGKICEGTVKFYAGDVKPSRYQWRGKIPSGIGWDRDWDGTPQDYGWEIYPPGLIRWGMATDRGHVITTPWPATDVRPPFWDGCGTLHNMAMYWDGEATWGAIRWGNKVHRWGQPPGAWA